MFPTERKFSPGFNLPVDLAGKYDAFFQEGSKDFLQALPSVSNENELLAFNVPMPPPGIQALLNKGTNRTKAIAGEYTSQLPSVAAGAAITTGDPLNEHLEKLIIQGKGKGLTSILSLGARMLNPGASRAMTLDDAKRLGYYK